MLLREAAPLPTGRTIRAFQAMILEAFHDMEEKHALHVRKFRLLKSFHAKATGTIAAYPANRA